MTYSLLLNSSYLTYVIPAEAGIQMFSITLDSRFHGNDNLNSLQTKNILIMN